jgi:predicted unusual protein kinase regulating ubiquinone biosynthesis (AarF/ABC1/UbiB family)
VKLAIFGRRRSVVLGFIDEFAMALRTELDYVAEGV